MSPPPTVPCRTCYVHHDGPAYEECDDCAAVRAMLAVLDGDGQVRAFRDLEQELEWTARRLKGVTRAS